MSTVYFILRWVALAALLLAANALYGCGHAPSGLRFTYHDATELQVMELDCVLELISSADLGLSASGQVWMVASIPDTPEGPVWGRTYGMDNYLTIDILESAREFHAEIFVHELMHVLAGQETGDRDGDHNDPRYFGPGSLTELYMHQAYELCQR